MGLLNSNAIRNGIATSEISVTIHHISIVDYWVRISV